MDKDLIPLAIAIAVWSIIVLARIIDITVVKTNKRADSKASNK